MDPIANIKRQRELARDIIGRVDSVEAASDPDHNNELIARDANELAELVIALDEWRTNGGFDPYLARSQ